MKVLERIEIEGGTKPKVIELCWGDLTELSKKDRVDVLVVSAFPGDYTPTPNSLIGALHAKGVSVGQLAMDKDVDLRETCSCWLSHPIFPFDPGIQYNRILCFEPLVLGSAPDVVSDIFRAITPMLGSSFKIESLAMPIVASGDMGNPVTRMLPPLLDAAVHWMGAGLPVSLLRIFVRNRKDANLPELEFKRTRSRLAPLTKSYKPDFEVFISYSSENEKTGNKIAAQLKKQGLSVFFGPRSIETGSPWPQQLFNAINTCHRMVALYTPAYLQSKCCQDEFGISWARRWDENREVIYPIYWQTTELPPHMKFLNYKDSRNRNESLLIQACNELASAFQT